MADAHFLTIKTTLYYVPLLELNAHHREQVSSLFAPVKMRGGVQPDEPVLDIFGPLMRFLLRPQARIEAQVQRFLDSLYSGARPRTTRSGLLVRSCRCSEYTCARRTRRTTPT